MTSIHRLQNTDATPGQSSATGPSPLLATEAESNGLDLHSYLRILRQYKWQLLVIVTLFSVAGYLFSTRLTPIYRADVKLLAEPLESATPNTPQYYSTAMIWLFYETQREILRSRNVALQVVDRLDLVARAKKAEKESAEENTKVFGIDWTLWLPEKWRETEEAQPSDADLRLRLADGIVKALDVEIAKDSQILAVSYEHKDPKQAAEIVNAVSVAYRDFGLSSRMGTAKEQTAFLNEQITSLKDKVNQAEAALQAYQEREGLIDTGSRQQINTAQLASLSEQLVTAEAARSEAEIRYREVERLRGGEGGYDSIAVVLQNDLINKLREKESELRRKVSELNERYGDKHPKMIAARSDLKEARQVLEGAVSKVVGGLKQEYQIALQKESKIRSLIGQRKQEMQQLQGKGLALAKLERDAENARELYSQYLTRAREMDVTSDYDVSNIRVIDTATVPKRPAKPNKTRIVLLFGLIGFGIGLGSIVMRDRMDTTYKLLEQVEQRLGLPGLGIVPLVAKRDKISVPERAAESGPTTPFAEAINHIRTGILFSNIDEPPQTVLVTSSVASEGKTTLASNLAASFSQIGRTLLVECDLRKPRLSGVYPLGKGGGLTDLVQDPDRLQDCILRVDPERDLWVLSAGTELPDPLRFLSSHSLEKLVFALRKKFTHIVVDAPPMLPVSDAVVLSRLVDGVVLAVRSESTTDRMARESLKRLRSSRCQLLGAVLTMVNAKRLSHYGRHYYADGGRYGYGEAYGYGYGYGNRGRGAKAEQG